MFFRAKSIHIFPSKEENSVGKKRQDFIGFLQSLVTYLQFYEHVSGGRGARVGGLRKTDIEWGLPKMEGLGQFADLRSGGVFLSGG